MNSPTPIFILETKTTEGATNVGVRQDKSGLIRDRAASEQPYRTPDEIRSNQNSSQSPQSNTAAPQRSNTISSHVPHGPVEFDGPLVPLTIQIPKHLKAKIQRLAAQDGESDSATARAFLARGVQANIDMQWNWPHESGSSASFVQRVSPYDKEPVAAAGLTSSAHIHCA